MLRHLSAAIFPRRLLETQPQTSVQSIENVRATQKPIKMPRSRGSRPAPARGAPPRPTVAPNRNAPAPTQQRSSSTAAAQPGARQQQQGGSGLFGQMAATAGCVPSLHLLGAVQSANVFNHLVAWQSAPPSDTPSAAFSVAAPARPLSSKTQPLHRPSSRRRTTITLAMQLGAMNRQSLSRDASTRIRENTR